MTGNSGANYRRGRHLRPRPPQTHVPPAGSAPPWLPDRSRREHLAERAEEPPLGSAATATCFHAEPRRTSARAGHSATCFHAEARRTATATATPYPASISRQRTDLGSATSKSFWRCGWGGIVRRCSHLDLECSAPPRAARSSRQFPTPPPVLRVSAWKSLGEWPARAAVLRGSAPPRGTTLREWPARAALLRALREMRPALKRERASRAGTPLPNRSTRRLSPSSRAR